MKRLFLSLVLTAFYATGYAQGRPYNSSVTVYSPYPTLQNQVQSPRYRSSNNGLYLGVGGVIDEPMNQRVVGSLMFVGDSYTATSISTSFNQLTDKMEYTVTIFVKLF